MEVEYELTRADMAAYLRFYQKYGPKPKPHPLVRAIRIALNVALFVLLFLVAWFVLQQRDDWIIGCCLGALVGMWITLALVGLQLTIAHRSASRLFDGEESRWLFSRRRLRINADGFETTNEFEQGRCSWSVVWLIDSTAEHAFFFTSATQAHVIPRRAFAVRRDFEDFIDLACRYHKGLPPRELTATEIIDALPVEQTRITLPRNP